MAGICNVAWAADEYFGIYMQGVKVGYSFSGEIDLKNQFPAVKESNSYSLLNSKLLGTNLDMELKSKTRYDVKGNLLWLESITTSNGRKQTVVATIKANTILIKVDNSGQIQNSTIKIPKGVRVVDDATAGITLNDFASLKNGVVVHVLDPTTVSLVPNTIIYLGKKTELINGFGTSVDVVEVRETRAITRLLFSAKGDLVRMEGPMGMEVRPESKAIAMDLSGNTRPDLATVTSIQVKPPVERPWMLKSMSFELTTPDSSLNLISDRNQTATRLASGWKVTLNPVDPKLSQPTTIAKAKAAQPKWAQASLHIASKNPQIIALSKKIIGKEVNPVIATQKICDWVNGNMTNNAGIGVLRDATEVLKTKEGVCRDYAILSAALLRASGIPTKLVSGMIYDLDAFYYHAWVEVYSGSQWVPFDPTRSHQQFAATHLKLAEGNVEDAFIFKVLDRTTLKVTGLIYRS